MNIPFDSYFRPGPSRFGAFRLALAISFSFAVSGGWAASQRQIATVTQSLAALQARLASVPGGAALSTIENQIANVLAALNQPTAVLNEQLATLNRVIRQAIEEGGLNIPSFTFPQIPPPAPGDPAEAVADLATAIAQGDTQSVEVLVTTFAHFLSSALNAPENAGTIAVALRATDTGSPQAAASAANIASAIARFAQSLPTETSSGTAQSASTLAAAVGAVIVRPAVIAAAPLMAANAAQAASVVASKPSVINASPAAAAQIARDTATVASSPAVILVAPALAGAIALNVSNIVTDPAVRSASPVLASSAAADATTIIHDETVSFSNQTVVAIVENNLGLTPISGINPALSVSPSGG